MNSDSESRTLNLLTFNCKNIKTCGKTFTELNSHADILMIQEHWLFECELKLLCECHKDLSGSGKAVDSNDPLPPTMMPRGYGGVAVLWRNELDKFIKPLSDGGTRIQCLELRIRNPMIIISVYMPTKNSSDTMDSFVDCIDQLYEIHRKYCLTHSFIIGGDFNEDLTKTTSNIRSEKLRTFMKECDLTTRYVGPTFINVYGQEVSEIDYFLYSSNLLVDEITRLDNVTSNTSDHYPLVMKTSVTIQTCSNSQDQTTSTKIPWNKVDKQQYAHSVNKGINDICSNTDMDNLSFEQVETVCKETNILLRTAAEKAAPRKKPKVKKSSLKVWNDNISRTLAVNRKAHKAWKNAGKPSQFHDPLLIAKKESRILYRRAVRNEIARQRMELKNKIIEANSTNKKLFFTLVRKQRQSGNSFINDLHVGDEYFESEEILQGWFKHFSELATPNEQSVFDFDFYNLCKKDHADIQKLYEHCESRKTTAAEIKEALKHINKGKAEDILVYQ